MKTNKLIVLVLFVLVSLSLFNCEKDSEEVFETNQFENSKNAHVCIEKWDQNDGSKAASLKNVQWQPGQTIRVKFLNGNNFVQSKVRQYAVAWESYANLKFEWVSSSSSANIKIGFREGQFADDGGSWSYLGTDSNNHAHSMHFGWFNNNTSDTEFRRTTIHEFGHALGLIHEHQNPVAGTKKLFITTMLDHLTIGVEHRWTTTYLDVTKQISLTTVCMIHNPSCIILFLQHTLLMELQ